MVREKKRPRKLGVKSSTNVRGRGCRTRAHDESIRGYLGWKDAHPGALIKVREPSVSAPVAAVVGVVPGAALPALPGRFRGAPQHPSAAVTGPGGGVPAFDVESDGGGWAARLFGRPDAIASSGEDMSDRAVAVAPTRGESQR